MVECIGFCTLYRQSLKVHINYHMTINIIDTCFIVWTEENCMIFLLLFVLQNTISVLFIVILKGRNMSFLGIIPQIE